MAILDFLFGKKQEEQKAPPVVFGPENKPAPGAKMLFTPSAAPAPVSGQGSSILSTPVGSGKKPPKIITPEAQKTFDDAKAFNIALEKKNSFQQSADTLRSLVNPKHYHEGASVDEFVESAIANGRRISAENYVSGKDALKKGGAAALTLGGLSQAGEGAISSMLDLPGRVGESLGFKNNPLLRTTGQQQIGILRSFIEQNAPERLQEFEAAVAQEGYSRGAEISGRTLATVAESVAVGSAVYRATAAIPAMQKLAEGGRWSRYLYTALQNVAADVGIRTEQMYKNKQTTSDVARGVASSPSMLFAFHSVPAIGLGVVADLYAGSVQGLPLQDNLLNAAMNLGGNTLDYRGLKETRRLADIPSQEIEAGFKGRSSGPAELINATWRESEMLYSYAQANPEDVKGVQKMYFDGEKRLLKLKKDLEKVSLSGESRPAGLKTTEGKVPAPEEPAAPKVPVTQAREHAKELLRQFEDSGIKAGEDDFITDEFGVQSHTMTKRSKDFANGAMEITGKGWLKKYGIKNTENLATKDSASIRNLIKQAIVDEPAGSARAYDMQRMLRQMPDDVDDELVGTLFATGRQKQGPLGQRLQEAIDSGFVSPKDQINETVTVQDVLDSLSSAETRTLSRGAGARGSSTEKQASTEVPGIRTRVEAKESFTDPLLSPREKNSLNQYADELLPKRPPAPETTSQSTERAAQQSALERQHTEFLEGPVQDASEVDPSFRPKDSGNMNTPYRERVTILDKWASPNYVLEKLGMKEQYRALRTAKHEARLDLQQRVNEIVEWKGRVPSKEGNIRLAKHLDGQIPLAQLTPEEQAVAKEIRPLLNEYARKLGLRPGRGFLQDYFPRIWDKSSMKAELPEDIALRIAESTDPASSIYNPFTQKRKGAEGYKLDTWAALEAYFRRSTRAVHMDPVLKDINAKTAELMDPSQVDYMTKFIERVNFRPTDTDTATDNLVKTYFGETFGPRPTSAITGKIRRAISRGAFWLNPMTYLRNLTQGVNTYKELGERFTVQGYANMAKKIATRDFAEWHREGVLDGGIVEELAPTAGKQLVRKADTVGFGGMKISEFLNRIPAYEGARAKAMAGKVKGIEKGNERAAIEYAKDIVEKTQFRMDELGLPQALSSDIAKTGLQFQPFTIKQIEFLGRSAKATAQGDTKEMLGLARYALGSAILLNTVGKAIGLDWKSFLPGARMLEDGGYIPPMLAPFIAFAQLAMGVRDDKRLDPVKSSLLFVPGGTQGKKMYDAEMMRRRGGQTSKSGKSFLYGPPEDGDLIDWLSAYALGPGSTKAANEHYNPGSSSEPGPIEKVKNLFSPPAPKQSGRLPIRSGAGIPSLERMTIPGR